MKKIWQTFLNSIKLPKKQAMHKLNRVGMDITIIYLLLLLLIVAIPSLVDQLMANNSAGAQMNTVFLMIYFFIFNYLPLAIMVFIFISLISYIFTGIAKLLQRQVRFPMLWKLTVYTTTLPFLFYTLLAFFVNTDNIVTALLIIYILLLMIKLITIYPKRRKRK
ncbi:hypothetical protein GCM10028778_00700 [Barrientosiimonas marina]|uniref:YIP1 family protein n=1 Tax=Lentibacillus kimchii TaxID=1542911 RepID=A0ABW2URG8_9BACI